MIYGHMAHTDFMDNSRIGTLTGFVIGAALLADLTFLPAILLTCKGPNE